MIISASNHLYNNKTAVDKLNVFPVPDGDTGTNMSLTLCAAADEIKKYVTASIGDVAHTLSNASLRGARGNSGVILSQFCRGIAQHLKDKNTADAKELTAALERGVQTAYKAVMRPTEGTILTVARESAAAAMQSAQENNDIETVMHDMIEEARKSLERTPELLPVLKESGVVDSGGAGLVLILEGAYHALTTSEPIQTQQSSAADAPVMATSIPSDNIRFAYCTEFIIDKKSADVNVKRFSGLIDAKGDCKLVIDDDEIVKVHIHTNNPGFVIEEAIKLGEISKIKIDNMRLQHETIITDGQNTQDAPAQASPAPPQSRKPYGFAAVASGDGLVGIFKDFGVDEIIMGGQSSNPSTDEILSAIEKINAECIYVLPNNKNIILAATQAQELSERDVVVLPTKSIPQGITALLAFLPHVGKDENTQKMTQAIELVRTGQVTCAVRDTSVSDKEIKTGDIIGISDGDIKIVGSSAGDVCKQLVSSLVDDSSSVVSVFYGGDVTEQEAQTLKTDLEAAYPALDIMLQNGGQPLYHYIISVE